MFCIARDSCIVDIRCTAGRPPERVASPRGMYHRACGSAAMLLIIAAVILPAPAAAAPEPPQKLPQDLQATLTTAIVTAADGGTWVPPAGLRPFLAAHPDQAWVVAHVAAPQLAARSGVIGYESPCRVAAGLSRELGIAAPEQASEIQEILSAGAPECDMIVTQAMEECLTPPSSGAVPGTRVQQNSSRMRQVFQPMKATEHGSNGGDCGGGCQTVEPGDPQIVRQFAF